MASNYAEFRFGWPVVFASAIGIGLGMSPLPFYTIGVFVAPYMQEFGWTPGQVLACFPIFTFYGAVHEPGDWPIDGSLRAASGSR